jgi:hypothetical protein
LSPSAHQRRQKATFPRQNIVPSLPTFPRRNPPVPPLMPQYPFATYARLSAVQCNCTLLDIPFEAFAPSKLNRAGRFVVQTWCRATLIKSAAPKLVRSGTRFESRFAATLCTLDLTVGDRFDFTETIGASRSTTRRNHPLQIVLFCSVVPGVPKPVASQPP